jgi:hypothetical protein
MKRDACMSFLRNATEQQLLAAVGLVMSMRPLPDYSERDPMRMRTIPDCSERDPVLNYSGYKEYRAWRCKWDAARMQEGLTEWMKENKASWKSAQAAL